MREVFLSKRAAAIFVFLACLGQMLFPSAPIDRQTAQSGANAPAVDSWTKDIDALTSELPKLHKNLFTRISEADFRAAAANLQASLPSLGPDESLVGVLKLVASIGDSHTTLGYQPRRLFPLMVYWYDDGLWIRNTVSEYREILNGRITAIEGRAIEEVVAALATLIPHENESQVRGHLPNFLADPALLHGLKLITRPDAARFTVRDAAGIERTVDLKAIPLSGRPAWVADLNAADGALFYLKNRRQDYWFEILPESGTLFFQYNS